eukprot:g76011.t1
MATPWFARYLTTLHVPDDVEPEQGVLDGANKPDRPPVKRQSSSRASVPATQAQPYTDCLGFSTLGTTLRWWSPFIAIVILGPFSLATLSADIFYMFEESSGQTAKVYNTLSEMNGMVMSLMLLLVILSTPVTLVRTLGCPGGSRALPKDGRPDHGCREVEELYKLPPEPFKMADANEQDKTKEAPMPQPLAKKSKVEELLKLKRCAHMEINDTSASSDKGAPKKDKADSPVECEHTETWFKFWPVDLAKNLAGCVKADDGEGQWGYRSMEEALDGHFGGIVMLATDDEEARVDNRFCEHHN